MPHAWIFVLPLLLVGCDPLETNPDDTIEGNQTGECSDGADNDLDGDFDCSDTDCAGAPICTSTREPDPGAEPNTPQETLSWFDGPLGASEVACGDEPGSAGGGWLIFTALQDTIEAPFVFLTLIERQHPWLGGDTVLVEEHRMDVFDGDAAWAGLMLSDNDAYLSNPGVESLFPCSVFHERLTYVVRSAVSETRPTGCVVFGYRPEDVVSGTVNIASATLFPADAYSTSLGFDDCVVIE